MRLEKSLDTSTPIAAEDLPKDISITEVCTGLKTWRNPINKFTIARLHYSADPRKRIKSWKEAARSGLTYAEWMREYEIYFSSFEGVPVYLDDYSRHFHVSQEPLVWSADYPIVRGWDFGLAAKGMACIFTQLVSNQRLMVYKELTSGDTDIVNFAPAVKAKSLEWFPGCFKFIDIVDPSGFTRSQIDKKMTCVRVVNEKLKTKCIPGERSIVKRRKSVIDFLQGNVRGMPKMLIDLEGASTLVEGFDGGYHYAYQKDGQIKDEPEKNEHSHIHDALQMVCGRIHQVDLSATAPITFATPSYGFGR